MKCRHCDREVPPSPRTGRVSKWLVIKAQDEGWFFHRDGTAYCPDHTPHWVEEWRAKRAAG